MKKQTAMMDLIEELKADMAYAISIEAPMVTEAIRITISKAEALLPTERQNIEEAYNEGALWSGDTASDFFTQTYEQK